MLWVPENLDSIAFYRIVAALGPQPRAARARIVQTVPALPSASLAFYRIVHGLCYFNRAVDPHGTLAEEVEAVREELDIFWEKKRLRHKIVSGRSNDTAADQRAQLREQRAYNAYVKYLSTGIKKYLPDEPVGDRNPLPDLVPPDTLEEAAWATPEVLHKGRHVSLWVPTPYDKDENRPFTALARRRREE